MHKTYEKVVIKIEQHTLLSKICSRVNNVTCLKEVLHEAQNRAISKD
jgi:hypothetical protein